MALTDKQMEARWGDNWDTPPHGQSATTGDACECDECTAWNRDYIEWENDTEDA